MSKKIMPASLRSETFEALLSDFDSILNRTLGNMEMKGAESATITLKLDLGLEKVTYNQKDIVKPTFKHTINSVMQIKDKRTGQFDGEYAMVWDETAERYVFQKIDNGQMELFQDDDDYVDADYYEVPALPEAASEEECDESDDDFPTDVESEEDVESEGPFAWLCDFIGEELHVVENGEFFTVRTVKDNAIILASTNSESKFYVDNDALAAHQSCRLTCVGYGEDFITQVSIECPDCGDTLFTMYAPGFEPVDEVEDYDYEEPEE